MNSNMTPNPNTTNILPNTAYLKTYEDYDDNVVTQYNSINNKLKSTIEYVIFKDLPNKIKKKSIKLEKNILENEVKNYVNFLNKEYSELINL